MDWRSGTLVGQELIVCTRRRAGLPVGVEGLTCGGEEAGNARSAASDRLARRWLPTPLPGELPADRG